MNLPSPLIQSLFPSPAGAKSLASPSPTNNHLTPSSLVSSLEWYSLILGARFQYFSLICLLWSALRSTLTTCSFSGRAFLDVRVIRIFFLLLVLHIHVSVLGLVVHSISAIWCQVHRMAHLDNQEVPVLTHLEQGSGRKPTAHHSTLEMSDPLTLCFIAFHKKTSGLTVETSVIGQCDNLIRWHVSQLSIYYEIPEVMNL